MKKTPTWLQAHLDVGVVPVGGAGHSARRARGQTGVGRHVVAAKGHPGLSVASTAAGPVPEVVGLVVAALRLAAAEVDVLQIDDVRDDVTVFGGKPDEVRALRVGNVTAGPENGPARRGAVEVLRVPDLAPIAGDDVGSG